MAAKNKYESLFFNALRELFVGAKIEGESGYINLMKIKAGYFEKGISGALKAEIDRVLEPFPDFREELFDKLYTFFQRYFSESGSIYFRHTAVHQNVYEKVYTDDRDVILFWKTHMLYYVKTDRIFNSMSVEVDGVKFYFDAGTMTLKKSNEKRETIYTFRQVDGSGQLVFEVTYSEKGRKTKVDDILKELKKADIKLSDETLDKAFRVFEKQSEVDYFINKDARAFLCEQFDIWLYQYLFAGQNIWTEERLAQLQGLKHVANVIIDFISQFEDELVKVWNKPKFVRNSHYVITLDKLMDMPVIANREAVKQSDGLAQIAAPGKERPARNDIFQRVLAHPNIEQQVQEWRELGMLGDDFRLEMLGEKDLGGAPALLKYQYLPLDTKYFTDLELEILSLFDDLDAALDGWLVHSENYQALSAMHQKFNKKVQCIYIDPPYNTAASEIIYQNQYKESSWISFMENRIHLATNFLTSDGVEIVAIDDTELIALSHLLSQILPSHDRNTVVINHHPAGAGLEGTNVSTTHEYALFMTPKGKKVLYGVEKTDPNGKIGFIRTGTAESNLRIGRPNSFYAVIVDPVSNKVMGAEPPPIGDDFPIGVTEEGFLRFYPLSSDGTQRVWRRSYESCLLEIINNNIECKNTTLYLLSDDSGKSRPIFSNWTDTKFNAGAYGTNLLTDIIGKPIFSYPKSIYNVMTCLNSATSRIKDALCLDFFAGSGTTAHAVMNLNSEDGGKRKYILVEMGEHFNTVILPRVKKVAFSSSWKEGKANGGQGMSHFVKYYDLEQYEDTLKKSLYRDANLFDNPYEKPWEHYIFLRDEKMLEALDVDVKNNAVHVHPERLYPDIDLAETLSQRRGKWIKRITAETVELEDGETLSLTDPDWNIIKPLVWW